ncbi:insulinase family protein [Pelagicoccus sp. SDUM812005]|uniref:M16 family metallopeptidase n=1 Tax=Pelagicoccus sp. SDUM812005 TaxID=3041257 RepID=UPI00280EA3F3|nr:insulinase family protein [Pelagicoccus sp. SDUM812005]MDQ8179068.1 insulinase family protein [Pelagicoccus sp. SDUM812005]
MREGWGSWRSVAVFVFSILLLPCVVEAKREKWPHEASSLQADESIVWGHLDNGFRYALKPHYAKPGLVSMRLMVKVGALDEEEDELGLSHFIEHMAFEGTRNFKPGELIAFFQKLGMSYGVDVNAFTYHDKTVYHLELPQNDAELIEQGLRLYRDYADGILFEEERVENEREVILREKQARDTPSSRISEASFRFSFAGTELAKRNPIGLESVIKETSIEKLKAFYRKWYRPDLMTLVVVGDIDPARFESQIAETFADLETPRGRAPKRKIGRLERSKPFRTGHLSVEGVERYTLEISRAWMERDGGDSWERRKEDAKRSFATAIFNERCRELIDGMSDDFANYNRVFGIPYCQLSISSGGEFWWDAFVWMDQLLRQALIYGFTQQELDYVRKTWLQSSRSAAARYETAEPRMLVDDLVDSIAMGRVYLASESFAKAMDRYIESLTLEELNKAFRDVWELKRMSYFVAGDLQESLSSLALKRRFNEDRKYAILPYVPKLPEVFEYSELGNPGTVVDSGTIDAIGAKTYRFSNNSRLTFLPSENEKGTVRAVVRVGGGMLGFKDTNPATHALAMGALFRSGFGGHDIEEVYKELRSNVSSFMFGVEDHDAFTYRGVTQVDGLDEFLKIVAEFLLDPTVDEEAFVVAQSKFKQSRELEPDGMNEGYRDLYRMLYPNEPRFHAPSLADIVSVQRDAVQTWLGEPLKAGYLEVAVVGDVEEELLLKLFSETIGALPTRRESKADFAAARALRTRPSAGKQRIEYKNGMGDSAASVIVWTIQEEITTRESAALYLLSNVFESRIRKRVREGMGASYSPSVRYVTFSAYDTLRHIRADVDCLKGDAESLLDVVLEISETLSSELVEADEIQAAVAPLEEGLKQAWQDNGYLLEHILYGVQEYPRVVERALAYKDGLLSTITADEMLAVARKYLKKDAALAVAIVPSEPSKIAEAPKWEETKRAGAIK